MKTKIRLAIGLGNPTADYADTYHNIGMMLLEFIASPEAEWKENPKKFSYCKKGPLTLMKPLAYMNESGKMAVPALAFAKAKPENLLIAHDDSDIALGEYKLSFGRNSAGHRGVDSFVKALRTKNFWRLRIGIRPKERSGARKKAGDLVLVKVKSSHKKIFAEIFEEIKKSPIWQN